MTPAELCRANGWGVGTVLVWEDGDCPTQDAEAKEITAIGRMYVLAVRVAVTTAKRPKWHRNYTCGTELPWHLELANRDDWRFATPAELEAIRAVTPQAKGERG